MRSVSITGKHMEQEPSTLLLGFSFPTTVVKNCFSVSVRAEHTGTLELHFHCYSVEHVHQKTRPRMIIRSLSVMAKNLEK